MPLLMSLQDLNPSLLRMVTPKGRYDLHVPAGTAEKFQTAIAPFHPTCGYGGACTRLRPAKP